MSHSIDQLFDAAQRLQQQGQLEQAITAYEAILAKDPHHLETLRFLGIAYAQLENMPQAILYLNRALESAPQDAGLHNNLANAYKKSHQFDKAIEHYLKALTIFPNYAEAHNNLAGVYALQNKFQQALTHYREAVHAKPAFVTAHYNLGLLLLRNNQLEAAKKQFHNVLALEPKHLDAQFYLGILYLEANQLEEASKAFNKVLALDEEHVNALANLGVIALKHNKGQLAVDYFTKALALDNTHIDARSNLAAAFIHHDRFENALMHYDVLLKEEPHNLEYLYNAGVAQMALGHLTEATKHFETMLHIQDDHFAALSNLAAIKIRLGQRREAILLLEHALAANPKDEVSQFMLNALTGREKKPEACPTYVGGLFNNYALYYDEHLQKTLNYALPHHIGRLLHTLHPKKVKHTVDLGCGTGLSGIVLRESSEHLVGVDLSAKMLVEAEKKGIYDELAEAELVAFLNEHKKSYDLMVAADVLPYLGALETLFNTVAHHLKKKGLFIFSHEINEKEPWKLQESARFSHHPDYIKSLCEKEGLHILSQEKVIARRQLQEPLYVMLYAVTRVS
jgi:predicted TPR repeat methyltransferase